MDVLALAYDLNFSYSFCSQSFVSEWWKSASISVQKLIVHWKAEQVTRASSLVVGV